MPHATAVVQKARAFKTSGDLFKQFLKVMEQCHRINVVFDVYREVSVKNTERSRVFVNQTWSLH